jgi:hypothetical protein
MSPQKLRQTIDERVFLGGVELHLRLEEIGSAPGEPFDPERE